MTAAEWREKLDSIVWATYGLLAEFEGLEQQVAAYKGGQAGPD